jgi:hypothetical protein
MKTSQELRLEYDLKIQTLLEEQIIKEAEMLLKLNN